MRHPCSRWNENGKERSHPVAKLHTYYLFFVLELEFDVNQDSQYQYDSTKHKEPIKEVAKHSNWWNNDVGGNGNNLQGPIKKILSSPLIICKHQLHKHKSKTAYSDNHGHNNATILVYSNMTNFLMVLLFQCIEHCQNLVCKYWIPFFHCSVGMVFRLKFLNLVLPLFI